MILNSKTNNPSQEKLRIRVRTIKFLLTVAIKFLLTVAILKCERICQPERQYLKLLLAS